MIKHILFPIILLSTPQNFQNQDLQKADLSGKDLHCAIFIHANLTGANLSEVNAQHANFQEAILNDANLSYGDFRYAFFDKASLGNVIAEGADFRGSEGLSIETIANLEKSGARFH